MNIKLIKRIECTSCKSQNRIAAAMITRWKCKFCDYSSMRGNGDIPIICRKCAMDKEMCQTCGNKLTEKEYQTYIEEEI